MITPLRIFPSRPFSGRLASGAEHLLAQIGCLGVGTGSHKACSRPGLGWLQKRTGARSLQSCLTLRNPVNCSPPGSSVRGVPPARILEWVAVPLPGDLPDAGIEPMSLTSPAFADGFFTTSSTTWETLFTEVCVCAKLLQPCPWWTVAHRAPVHGILEWVAISFFIFSEN